MKHNSTNGRAIAKATKEYALGKCNCEKMGRLIKMEAVTAGGTIWLALKLGLSVRETRKIGN